MSDNISRILFASAVMLIASGCISHGPGGVAYEKTDTPATAVGGTAGTGNGTVTGGSVTPGAAPEKKEERGTPRVGTSRDGSGPADGAIVDPTGAATKGKPY